MNENVTKNLQWKDKFRTDVFPVIAQIQHKLGKSWQEIGESKLGNATLIAQAKQIASTLKPEKAEKPLNIYFVTMLGGIANIVCTELLFAWALRQKGHNINFILDDNCLPMTEETLIGKEAVWEAKKAASYYYGQKLINAAGFKLLNVSEIVDIKAERDISAYQYIIEAGLFKHYRVGVITPELKDVDKKSSMLADSARISALVGDYVVRQNPDLVIMSHGIYPTWGPLFDIIDKAGISIVTYGSGKKAKTRKLNWNHVGSWWDVSEEWAKVKEKPLTPSQQSKIDQYLQTRVNHSQDVRVYNFGGLEDADKTRTRFRLSPNKLTYALFTNVMWDAASAQREIAFQNPVEWVLETIKWFGTQPNKQLIVKIHPAEKVIGTNQPFAGTIRKAFEKIPDNVVLIEPHVEVNSWSIYEVTDLGIVHTTTAGMELPLLGKPCVVVSRTHFRDKGFTIDVNSREEYFSFLQDFEPSKVDGSRLKVLAERYSYLLFERYQIPFTLLHEPVFRRTVALNIDKVADLFNDKYMHLLIDAILHKKPFLLEEDA
jgi:hypothetical protein